MERKLNISDIKSINDLDALRKEVNEEFDTRRNELERIDEAYTLSKKPFGYLKEAFGNFSSSLFKTNKGRECIKKYITTIKENKALSELYSIYEGIRKTGKDSDVNYFVNNLTEGKNVFSSQEISDAKDKLGKVLAEAYFILGDESRNLLPEENISLDKAIAYITENKKTTKTLAEYSNAAKVIRENIEKNETASNIFADKDVDKIAEELVREFNEKYAEQLTDEESALVKQISETSDKEKLFNECKENCLKKIAENKENCDELSAEKISSIYEQVNKKQFSSETANEDICNLIEIAKVF